MVGPRRPGAAGRRPRMHLDAMAWSNPQLRLRDFDICPLERARIIPETVLRVNKWGADTNSSVQDQAFAAALRLRVPGRREGRTLGGEPLGRQLGEAVCFERGYERAGGASRR